MSPSISIAATVTDIAYVDGKGKHGSRSTPTKYIV